MKNITVWCYSLSLPKSMPKQPTSPKESENLRYAHLTSGFLLLILFLYTPSGVLMLFDSPPGSSSLLISACVFVILLISFFCGRAGWQIASASAIVAYNLLLVTSILITNLLDPSFFPIV